MVILHVVQRHNEFLFLQTCKKQNADHTIAVMVTTLYIISMVTSADSSRGMIHPAVLCCIR